MIAGIRKHRGQNSLTEVDIVARRSEANRRCGSRMVISGLRHHRSEAMRCHIASDDKYQTLNGPELFTQAGIQIRIEWKFIKVIDVLQRIERKVLERGWRIGQRLYFRSRILNTRPGNPVLLRLIRILLFPQLMPQAHPVEWNLEVDQVDHHG